MINPYGEEHNFNRFVLVSVVLHAIIFLTFPQWSSLFMSDTQAWEMAVHSNPRSVKQR